MPRKGRKTIDLPTLTVNKWKLIFKENKRELSLMGITTFSGMMSWILNYVLEEGFLPKEIEKFLPVESE